MVTTEDMRRLRKNYKRRSNNQTFIQNIVDKMIRNTEAGKHWLKKEEQGSDSSDDEEPEGSEAGQEPAREEGEISNPSEDSDEPGSNGEAEQYTSEVEVCSAEYSSSQ